MLAPVPELGEQLERQRQVLETLGPIAEPPADVAKVVMHVSEGDRVAEAVRAGQRRALQRRDILYLAAALQDR